MYLYVLLEIELALIAAEHLNGWGEVVACAKWILAVGCDFRGLWSNTHMLACGWLAICLYGRCTNLGKPQNSLVLESVKECPRVSKRCVSYALLQNLDTGALALQ
jgi:hypothetical protein